MQGGRGGGGGGIGKIRTHKDREAKMRVHKIHTYFDVPGKESSK